MEAKREGAGRAGRAGWAGGTVKGRAGAAGRAGKTVTEARKRAHRAVTSLLAGRAWPKAVAAAVAQDALVTTAKAGPGVSKAVSFHCSNPGCLVSITSGAIHFAFAGTGGATFPAGANNVFYVVMGPASQAFAITVDGGALDAPLDSVLTSQGKAGGMRVLTVKG